MRAGRAALLGAVATACTAASPNASARDVPVQIPTREAVVRVGAYGTVPALAVASARVFVVGEDGVAIWDRGLGRWLPPVPLDLRRPGRALGRTLAAASPSGDAVWVASGGRVFVVNPSLRAAFVSAIDGEPRELVVARTGASAFVRALNWWEVSAAGTVHMATGMVGRATPDVVYADGAALRRAADDPLLSRDASLRSWPVLAAVQGATPSEVWLGTEGGGVFRVDVDFHRSEQMAFGLRGGAVVALARTADGIVAAEGRATLYGSVAPGTFVTEGTDDLARWRWHALADQVGPIASIALRGRSLCVAGESGAGIIDLAGGSATALPAALRRVEPAPSHVALAARDGCLVGTWNGVTLIPWDAGGNAPREPSRSDPLSPVTALAAAGDTVWAGTRDGVVALVGGRAVGVMRPLPSGGDVVAVALVPGGLAVATETDLALVTSAGASRPPSPAAVVARITSLAADDRTLWVGGEAGAVAIPLDGGPRVTVPLAGAGAAEREPLGGRAVHAIVLAPGVAWLGTTAGLVRVRRGPDGLPR